MVSISSKSTAYVILGMLEMGPMSGYEIKKFVDVSTRFFWAASYGQIYPELKRLSEAGLITGEAGATGDRRRTTYTLTDTGRGELRRWLAEAPATFEMRDEALLKLFFSTGNDGANAVEALEADRAHHRAVADHLAAMEPMVVESKDRYKLAVLRVGLGLHSRAAELCEQAKREFIDAAEPKGSAPDA